MPGAARRTDARTLAGWEGTQLAAYGVGAVPLMTACLVRVLTTPRLTVSRGYSTGRSRQIDGPPGTGSDPADDSTTRYVADDRYPGTRERGRGRGRGVLNFRYGGGVEYARARVSVETLLDVWDDLQMPAVLPALYLRHLRGVAEERVPDGPSPASGASRRPAHFRHRRGRPPERFYQDESGPGECGSASVADNDSRLAREGFAFRRHDADLRTRIAPPDATTACCSSRYYRPEIKIAVTFLSESSGEPRIDFCHNGYSQPACATWAGRYQYLSLTHVRAVMAAARQRTDRRLSRTRCTGTMRKIAGPASGFRIGETSGPDA
jgi:hypothetical protein